MRMNYLFGPALLVSIAACGDATVTSEEDLAQTEDASAGPELTAIQQANFDRFDRQQFRETYAELRQEAIAKPSEECPLPPPDEVDFDCLDRDGDERLSAAEFALWKIPSMANGAVVAEGNVTDEEVDEVARAFFANDLDGSLDLTPGEFRAASGRPLSE